MDHETATTVAIVILSLTALTFWAAAEFQLRRPANQERLDGPDTRDRDAIADVIGLLDKRRTPANDAEFTDLLEYRLRRDRGEQGAGEGVFLMGAAILALFWAAVSVVAR